MSNAASSNAEVMRRGNLTKDPIPGEGKGKTFCRFSIAVETPKVAGDWQGEREVTYYECVAFDRTADNVVASLRKGDAVVVIGRGEVDEWTGRDGQKRVTKQIVCNVVAVDLFRGPVTVQRQERRQTVERPAPRPTVAVGTPDEF